jgi:hypothetical protein
LIIFHDKSKPESGIAVLKRAWGKRENSGKNQHWSWQFTVWRSFSEGDFRTMILAAVNQ